VFGLAPNLNSKLASDTFENVAPLMHWLIYPILTIARASTWIGAMGIVILSVVPAVDRPVTGGGQSFEHVAAFAIVSGLFAIGYQISLAAQIFSAFMFCTFVEVIQIPVPSRHARASDLAIDLAASCGTILIVRLVKRIFATAPHTNS
jgi:hypothetical protein